MTSAAHAHVRVLVHEVYDPGSLLQAIEDYQLHLTVSILRREEDRTAVTFAAPNGEQPVEQLVHEFLNYLLDLSVRSILGAA